VRGRFGRLNREPAGEAIRRNIALNRGKEGGGLVATFREEQTRTGWSRTRWLLLVGVLAAIVVAVVLVVVYAGGGGSGGGGY
jgi:hypothetical protein